jgi:hypothetical protein
MLRRVVLSLSSLIAASTAAAQIGYWDPAFRNVPFDEWFSNGGQASIRWTVHLFRPHLSSHQRLMTQMEILVDGREFAKRLGEGREMVVFVEVDDAAGRPYQNHVALDLKKMQDAIRTQDISCLMSFFVLPGDYNLRLAVYASATGEHSVKEEKLHVAPVKSDPLPEMWRGLPHVEFIDPSEPPESWFLPSVTGRLHLPVAAKKPVRVEVLVNMTPSERLSGSGRAQNRNLGALIPALKTISQIDMRNGAMDVELLDLSRQRVTFHQEDVRTLDWPAMKAGLTEAKPGVIDIKSLEHRKENAGFFVSEVSRIIEQSAAAPARALIVLSGPVEFEGGQDLQPIAITPPPGFRVYYIRYRVPPRPVVIPGDPDSITGRQPPMIGGVGRGGRGPRGEIQGGLGRYAIVDQLEATVKPLVPRLFDVNTAEEFRKALATVLSDIERM